MSSYGMELQAAAELCNRVGMEIQADLSILEIQNVTSLIELCEKTIAKTQVQKPA